jgi:hypothetical protein
VDEIKEFPDYWKDQRFWQKRPNGKNARFRRGDRIYEPLPEGGFRQLRSFRSDSEKYKDLSGVRVLISETFAYFGSKPLPLPPELQKLVVGRKYKNHFSDDTILQFLHFVTTQRFGLHAPPSRWDDGDDSWRTAD